MKFINSILTVILLIAGLGGIAYMVENDMVREFLTENGANDNDDEDTGEERIHIIDGYKAVKLDDEQLENAGIQSEQLSVMEFRPELSAHAEVIDIAPLVNLKTGYANLHAEKKILQNALQNLRANLARAQALHKARSLSTRELEQHRAAVDNKNAELDAVLTRIDSLAYRIKSDWGEVTGSMVLDADKEPLFNRLAMHEDFLVMLSLPKNMTLTGTDQNVYVNHVNRRAGAVSATYLDQARHAGNPLYGESYIYLVSSEKLRPGMRLFAWIEETDETLTGLFVPEKAVIWYANDPWIYIQHDRDIFVRKPLAGAKRVENGWLLNNGVDRDDMVVVKGGQTLLSEEFKWAIPDEDAD